MLLSTWVNQLVLFQRHVTAVLRAVSLAGVVTWSRRQPSGSTNCWFLSMQLLLSIFLLFSSFIQSAMVHFTSHNLPISAFTYPISKPLQYQREQPLAYVPSLPQKLQHSTTHHHQLHFSICIMWQILQFDLPLHQSAFFPPFLSCPNPQNSKLLLTCFL